MDTEKDEKKVVREWAKWNNVVSYFTVAAIPIGLSAVAVGSIFVYHCLTPKPAAPKSPTTYSAGLNAAKQSASQTTPPAEQTKPPEGETATPSTGSSESHGHWNAGKDPLQYDSHGLAIIDEAASSGTLEARPDGGRGVGCDAPNCPDGRTDSAQQSASSNPTPPNPNPSESQPTEPVQSAKATPPSGISLTGGIFNEGNLHAEIYAPCQRKAGARIVCDGWFRNDARDTQTIIFEEWSTKIGRGLAFLDTGDVVPIYRASSKFGEFHEAALLPGKYVKFQISFPDTSEGRSTSVSIILSIRLGDISGSAKFAGDITII